MDLHLIVDFNSFFAIFNLAPINILYDLEVIKTSNICCESNTDDKLLVIQCSPLKVNSLGPEKKCSLYPRFTLILAKIKATDRRCVAPRV